MNKDVQCHILCCEVCQRIKVEATKAAGLLQPFPILNKPWFHINMGFIEGLPKSHGYEVILMAIDRLTKFVHFSPLSHPYTATKVAT